MTNEIPETVRPILWSYDFDRLDPMKHRRTIVVQIVNYGTLAHWRWLKKQYGRGGVREILSSIPATEIRLPARRLAALIFGIDQYNHAQRGTH